MARVSKVGSLLCAGIVLLALALTPAAAIQASRSDLDREGTKGSVMVRAVGQGGFNLNSPAWDKIVRDRAAGSVEIDYRSVDCPSSRNMAVRIENDSNAYNFVLQILGAAKSGGVEKVEISKDGRDWKSMKNNGWGATWVLNPAKDIVDAGRKVSVRVTAVGGGQQVVLQDVIPSKWSGGKIYESSTNF
ncbi:unnamed protein product [Closterium sp. NIES-64]|nr:unnamed protein product [Closterium sp. NIES-64]